MANIRQETGNILDFKADTIICPCYSDLTYLKEDNLFKKLVTKAGPELLKELSAIGYCKIGNAVMTLPYKLPYKKVIFIAYKDLNSKEETTDHMLLHQAYKSAINLAVIYGIKNMCTSMIPVPIVKEKVANKFTGLFKLELPQATVNPKETIEIAKTVASEFDDLIEDFAIFE